MKKNFKLMYCVAIVIAIIIFFLIVLLFQDDDFTEENVSENEELNQVSGESFSNLLGYDVEITEDTLTFSSPDGVVVVYSFENDHLIDIVQVITADTAEAAEYTGDIFKEQVSEGLIENVQVKENIVSIKYNMEYFEEYKNYTKDEIQDIIFGNENVITEEKGE